MKITEQFTTSIYGFKSYGSLARMKGGKSFLYIFLLFLLMYLVFSINITRTANVIVDILSDSEIIDKIPDFSIKDGILTVDAPMPFVQEADGLTIIVDTTKTSDELLEQHDIINGFVITKDEFVTVLPGQVQSFDFSLLQDEFDKNDLLRIMSNFKGFIQAFLWIFLAFWIIFAFAGKMLGVLVLTLIALIASAVYNQRLSFQENWNIAIYASTVPVLFSCVHSLLGSPLRALGFFIYWGLAIAYVFVGMYYIARENELNQSPEIIEAPLV
ncbi:MAG TPA: DUF1189 domain-containing protein [Candidatus Atribacteria bacterium]|nr:DUF1189 domain-containing protein [Candidatus Atribacteria bacterium]